jgi:hypothetical protein
VTGRATNAAVIASCRDAPAKLFCAATARKTGVDLSSSTVNDYQKCDSDCESIARHLNASRRLYQVRTATSQPVPTGVVRTDRRMMMAVTLAILRFGTNAQMALIAATRLRAQGCGG